MRPDRYYQPDGFRHREGDRATSECDAKRSPSLAGADVGAHQRNHGCAEPEYQRNEQVFEPSAGTVSRDGAGPAGDSDQRGRQGKHERGLERIDGADRTHAQDVGEQVLAKPRKHRSNHECPAHRYQPSAPADRQL